MIDTELQLETALHTGGNLRMPYNHEQRLAERAAILRQIAELDAQWSRDKVPAEAECPIHQHGFNLPTGCYWCERERLVACLPFVWANNYGEDDDGKLRLVDESAERLEEFKTSRHYDDAGVLATVKIQVNR